MFSTVFPYKNKIGNLSCTVSRKLYITEVVYYSHSEKQLELISDLMPSG